MGGSYHHWCHQWCWTGSGTNSCSQWLWSLEFTEPIFQQKFQKHGQQRMKKKHDDWRAKNVQVIVIYYHCKHWPWRSLKWTWRTRLQDVYVTGRTLQKAKEAVADVGTTATGQAKRSTKNDEKMYKDKCQGNIGTNLWQFDGKTVFAVSFVCRNLFVCHLFGLLTCWLRRCFLWSSTWPLWRLSATLWLNGNLPSGGKGKLQTSISSISSISNKLWTMELLEQSGHRKPVDILACNAGLALGTQPGMGRFWRCNFIDILMAHEWYWWFLHVSSRSRPNRTAIHRRRSGRPNGNV